jgi:hypothetical protein
VGNDEFDAMHVGGIASSTFSFVKSHNLSGLDPENAVMNRLSLRAIAFIMVLSALHIAGIEPPKVAAIPQPQETASQRGPNPLTALRPGNLGLPGPMAATLHSAQP